ncbi:MAG: hypothetical protein IT429_06320 [Gemmataceae bacterium]|nr:hypothetical protein [Gemmataceae bacterium]
MNSPDDVPPQGDTAPADPNTDLGAAGPGFNFADPNSPLAPFYLQSSHLVAVFLLGLLFVFVSLMVPLAYTDSWGHLAFGRWMAEHGKLPTHEPFSPFSDHDAPYVNFQWLPQLVGYWLYQTGANLAGGDSLHQLAGGVQLLRAGHAVVVVLRFFVLLLAFRRLSGSLPLACVGIVIVFLFSIVPSSVQRPQAVGELLFACLLLPLASPLLTRRALILIPLVFALWANCHGSFFLGFALLAVFLAGRGLEVLRAAGSWNPLRTLADPQVRRLLLVLVLSVGVAALLNPYGPALYLDVLQMARHPNIATMEEWQPLDFVLGGGGGHWGYLALLLLIGTSQALSPRGLAPTAMLLLATFGVLPLFQQRQMVWWIMLVPWLLLPLWVAIGERLPWSFLHARSTPDLRKTVLGVLLAGMALLWSGPAHWLTTGSPQPLPQVVAPGTPWRLAAQLQLAADQKKPVLPKLAKALRDRGYPGGQFSGRIFAGETLGDYLLFTLRPGTELLAYNHVHLFPRAYWQDIMTALFGLPSWWDVLDRYGVNLIVIEADMRKALADEVRVSPEWEVVLDEGNPSSVGTRRGGGLLIALRKKPLPSPGAGR